MLGSHLLLARASLNTTRASIEAGVVVHGHVVDDGPVDVGVVDVRHAHVIDRGVVGEVSAFPAPAAEANAAKAEAVVHATVEANVGSPITFMKAVDTTGEAPVRRRPEDSDAGRLDPDAGNPVVPLRTVGPITGVPEITVARADGLCVNGQNGGCETDRDKDPGERCRRGDGECRCDQKLANRTCFEHAVSPNPPHPALCLALPDAVRVGPACECRRPFLRSFQPTWNKEVLSRAQLLDEMTSSPDYKALA
ncbi:hypothetical protein GRAN_2061 [Granulicella sibirica]|uniref:Uncharacterized protein n=1 Tax=Granulicella sibirica TaxID=2479048 RepID=A0A4Q0TAS5_9BACT|nr:hypothetical protein GRAN_2061 [Granulicella sibirica]